MKYMIGRIIEQEKDQVLEGAFGRTKTLKAGTKGTMGADGFVHWWNGMMQKIEDPEAEGYDLQDVAMTILSRLKTTFPLEEFMDGYDIDDVDIINDIEFTLEEYVGMS